MDREKDVQNPSDAQPGTQPDAQPDAQPSQQETPSDAPAGDSQPSAGTQPPEQQQPSASASSPQQTEDVEKQQASPQDDEEDDEDDDSLCFPNARVVRIIREEIKSGKQIRSSVKSAANEWLGEMLRKAAREMDQSPYGSIGMADFNRAIKPHEMIQHIVKDRQRIMLSIEKLKQDADQVKRDLMRFYTKVTGEEQKEDI